MNNPTKRLLTRILVVAVVTMTATLSAGYLRTVAPLVPLFYLLVPVVVAFFGGVFLEKSFTEEAIAAALRERSRWRGDRYAERWQERDPQ